jgi:hypothetical protein
MRYDYDADHEGNLHYRSGFDNIES